MRKYATILAIVFTIASPAIANAQEPCPAGDMFFYDSNGRTQAVVSELASAGNTLHYEVYTSTEGGYVYLDNSTGGTYTIGANGLNNKYVWSSYVIPEDMRISKVYFTGIKKYILQMCLDTSTVPEPTATATTEPTATATTEPTATATTEPTATATTEPTATATTEPTATATATPKPVQERIDLNGFIVSIVGVFQIIGGASSLITLGVLIWLASRLFKGFK